MAKTLDIAQAQTQLARLMSRNHERVLVTKRGKPVGAIVSAQDLAKLEEVENREILKRARAIKKATNMKDLEQLGESDKRRILRRVRTIEKKTKKFIPWKQFIRNYEKKWNVDLRQVEPEEF